MTIQSTVDAMIGNESPDFNYGTYDHIRIGESSVEAALYRGLIKFDLSSIMGNVVTTGTLQIYHSGTEYADNIGTLRVNRIYKNWTEAGATWNKYDGATSWSEAGAGAQGVDYELENIGTTTVSPTAGAGWVSIPLDTGKINTWLSGGVSNYGLGLFMLNEVSNQHWFQSAEGANPPQLVIELGGAVLNTTSKSW